MGLTMRSSMVVMLMPFVWLNLASGFIAQTRFSGPASSRLRVRTHLKTSPYVDEPSRLSSLSSDEAIFVLSMISDDDLRRKTVKFYLDDGLRREQSFFTTGSFWRRDQSTFVRQSKEHLKLISSAVQADAWESNVTDGCKNPGCQPQQLWACVDMTVQFSKVFRDFNEECQGEAQDVFQ